MSDVISWIAAEAGDWKDPLKPSLPAPTLRREGDCKESGHKFFTQHLPQHNFPETPEAPPEEVLEPACNDLPSEASPYEEVLENDPLDRNPELRAYRRNTTSLLRRYMKYSLETGRLPSVLGSEFFRSGVTSYTATTFEDRVVFTHDMEICLERLDEFSRQLIARCVLQEHSRWEAARLLHCNEKTIRRMVPVALDLLSEILLEVGVMERKNTNCEKSCQGGKTDQFPVSDCEEGENKF